MEKVLRRTSTSTLAALILAAGAAHADYIPGTLVTYWPLNETNTSSTVVVDSSDNHNDGTLRRGVGAAYIANINPLWNTGSGPVIDGNPTNAFRLNGSNQFMVAPESPSIDWNKSKGTISLWVNSDILERQSILRDTANQMSIEVTGTSGGGNYRFYFHPNAANGSSVYFMTDVSLTPGTWQHLVFTWDLTATDSGDAANPNKVKAWVNGVAQTNFNLEGNNVDTGWLTAANTGTFYLGRRPEEPTRYFRGRYAEVAFYNDALNAAEATALHTDGVNTADSRLVSYWNFGEGSGTETADHTANGNDLQLVETDFPVAERNGPTFDTVNNALELDGINDVGLIPSSPEINFDKTQGTISLWVNSDVLQRQSIIRDTTSSMSIEVTGTSGGTNYNFYFHPNAIDGSNNYFMTTATLTPGTWQHLVFAWDFNADTTGSTLTSPKKVKAWVNGVAQANFSTGSNDVDVLWTHVPATSNWIVGSRFVDPLRPFNGKIDEVAFFDVALDDAAVQAIYNDPINPSDPNLVAFYPFNDGSGTRADDASANDNAMILGEPGGPAFPEALGGQWVTAAPAGKPDYITRALDFDGTNGFFDAPDSASFDWNKTTGTIVFLAYFRDNGRMGLIGDTARGIETESHSSSTGRIFFNPNRQNGASNYFMTNGTRTLNGWMHVAYVWDRGATPSGDTANPARVKVYFNGVEQSNVVVENNDVDTLWTSAANTANWVVGRRADLNDNINTRYFNGQLADMAIFNNALPPEDIQFINDEGVEEYLRTAPTPTPSPSPTLTPSPTASVTPSPSVSPSPSATPTVSPTASPTPTPTPTVFTFDNDEEGWQFFNPALFATVVGAHNHETGMLDATTQENTDSFAYWESPIFTINSGGGRGGSGIPITGLIGSRSLYRSTFTIVGNVELAEAPTFRVRSSSFNFEQGDAIVVTSRGEGSLSPPSAGRDYVQYFTQPAETNSFRLDFDILNFDPSDAAAATLSLDRVVVQALEVPGAAQGTQIASIVFDGSANGFTPRNGGAPLNTPVEFSSASGLLIRGANPIKSNKGLVTPGTIFGFWGSETNFAIEGGAIYGLTFTVRTTASSVDRANIPAFRMRMNDSSLRFSSFINIDSRSGGSRVPVDNVPETYVMFFEAPHDIHGETFILSFDYLYTPESGDDPAIAVILDSLSITQFDSHVFGMAK